MKKLIILFISSTLIMSCASVEYNSKYQARNISRFSKAKHKGTFITSNKRGDHNHPAVTKETRKSF